MWSTPSPQGVREHLRRDGDAQAIHANYWLSGIAGHQLKHELDLPLVSTFHTLARVKAEVGDEEPLRRVNAESDVIGCSDAILASCTAEADQLVELYDAPRPRIEIVPPGVDHAFFSPGDRRGARHALGLGDHPVLLFVGRIQPLKGLLVAIEALALLDDPERGARRRGRAERCRRSRRVGPGAPPSRRPGPARAGSIRCAAAPPPPVDLLPRRRHMRRAEPVRVLRIGCARSGRVWHAGCGRSGGRSDFHRRGRAHGVLGRRPGGLVVRLGLSSPARRQAARTRHGRSRRRTSAWLHVVDHRGPAAAALRGSRLAIARQLFVTIVGTIDGRRDRDT